MCQSIPPKTSLVPTKSRKTSELCKAGVPLPPGPSRRAEKMRHNAASAAENEIGVPAMRRERSYVLPPHATSNDGRSMQAERCRCTPGSSAYACMFTQQQLSGVKAFFFFFLGEIRGWLIVGWWVLRHLGDAERGMSESWWGCEMERAAFPLRRTTPRPTHASVVVQ